MRVVAVYGGGDDEVECLDVRPKDARTETTYAVGVLMTPKKKEKRHLRTPTTLFTNTKLRYTDPDVMVSSGLTRVHRTQARPLDTRACTNATRMDRDTKRATD